MTADDLAAHAARVEAERYVENPVLTPVLADLLDETSPSRILFLHGPGGLGKSTALRAVAREATGAYAVRILDGRDLGPDVLPDTLLPRIDGPALLIVDEADALGAALHRLGRLLLRLPSTARVLIGGRRAPAHGWVPDELGPVIRVVRMPRLPSSQAAELLRRHGVLGRRRIEHLVSGAQGSPLALVVAAESDLTPGTTPPARAEELIRRLAGTALHGLDQEVLHVAALTSVIDEELLGDLLPDRDLAAAYAHLREQTFVEWRGNRATLHPLLANAVRDRFAEEMPARHRTLSLRLASALRDRALAGRPGALPALASLVSDPELRRGLGSGGAEQYYAAPIRPQDHRLVADALDPRLSRPPVADALASTIDAGFAVRTADGSCIAVATVLPTTTRVEGPFVEPLVRFARDQGIAADCVLTPLQVSLGSRDRDPDLEAFRNAVALRRCGLANPHHDLVNEIGWGDGEDEVMRRFGYSEVPELRRDVGGVEVRTWLAGTGPGGLVGLVHRAVLAEYGVEVGSPAEGRVDLVDALDGFHSDSVMAALELAPQGHPAADAAEAARRTVRRTVTRVLADRPELLDLVERRYFTAGATHEDVIRQSFLSRRSYFRRLSEIRRLVQETD